MYPPYLKDCCPKFVDHSGCSLNQKVFQYEGFLAMIDVSRKCESTTGIQINGIDVMSNIEDIQHPPLFEKIV